MNRWLLADPDSVTQEELEQNLDDARAAAEAAAAAAADAARAAAYAAARAPAYTGERR